MQLSRECGFFRLEFSRWDGESREEVRERGLGCSAKMCHRFAEFRRVPVNHVVRGKYTRPGEVKLWRARQTV